MLITGVLLSSTPQTPISLYPNGLTIFPRVGIYNIFSQAPIWRPVLFSIFQ